MFIAKVSVAEAARWLGVGVPRIHHRIADGSLPAERLGSQWVVDELSLVRVAEHQKAGRPLSARSAWAIIALAEGDDEALAALAPSERSRAKANFRNEDLSKKDRQRLRGMLTAIDKDRELSLEVLGAPESIARLRLAANLD